MPIRIQLSRAKGWRKPEGARVVTRATIFGNPWVVDTVVAFCWPEVPKAGWVSRHAIPAGALTQAQAVRAFAVWIYGYSIPGNMRPVNLDKYERQRLRDDMHGRRAAIWQALHLGELQGRDLCCTCPLDAPCHADVLLALAADQRADLSRWLDMED